MWTGAENGAVGIGGSVRDVEAVESTADHRNTLSTLHPTRSGFAATSRIFERHTDVFLPDLHVALGGELVLSQEGVNCASIP